MPETPETYTLAEVRAMLTVERVVLMDQCHQQALAVTAPSESYRNGYMSACEDLQNLIKAREAREPK